jgi:hypothetical protein
MVTDEVFLGSESLVGIGIGIGIIRVCIIWDTTCISGYFDKVAKADFGIHIRRTRGYYSYRLLMRLLLLYLWLLKFKLLELLLYFKKGSIFGVDSMSLTECV